MNQIVNTLTASRQARKKLVPTTLIFLVFFGFYLLSQFHVDGESWGAVGLLPTLLVLALAIISRKPFESLMAGAFAGMIMLSNDNLVGVFSDSLSTVMGDETIVWLILVCGLMGGLIVLLEISGCLGSFSKWLQGKVKSQRQSLLTTFFIGLLVFIDDYLNCLAVSSSVKKLTDYYQVSREKLAYIIDSTAAPMCVIVPVSTWAVFFAGLLEENELAASGQGLSLYISSIPFMIYGWVALIVVFLVANGNIGDIGPMKKAEERAKNGQPIPDDFIGEEIEGKDLSERKISNTAGMINFFFPMILLIVSTVYYDIDLLKGVLLTLAVTITLYYVQGLLSFEKQVNAIFDGVKVMLYPVSTVIAGFILKEVNDNLGMTTYVIESVTPWMTKEMLPAIVFIVMSSVVFGTASSWGVFIIAIPIVMPIAFSVDASIPLVIGALLSAASFGSHACFFSDSTVLAAQGAGCSAMSHAYTQIPYAIIGAVASILIFLALGFYVQ